MSTTAYTGRVTNWPGVVASGLLLIPLLGLALASGSLGDTGVFVLVLALVALLGEVVTASDVRAACGPQGVQIRWGVFGWPRVSYSLARIEDAVVVEVPWWAVTFGFWWTPTRTVCTVRTGPALRMRLRGGRKVTLTVPDAHAAVAALHAARGSGVGAGG